MNIGILTFPLSNNYGCLLQAYALKKALESLGHNVYVLNKKRWKSSTNMGQFMVLLKNIVYTTLLRDKNRVGNSDIIYSWINSSYYISQNIRRFANKRLSLSENIYDFSKSTVINDLGLDAVVVGSDQVWRYSYLSNIKNYFLDFVPNNIIKFSYAASFGVDKWEYPKHVSDECSKLLDSFSGISVRENIGVYLCKTYFHKEAKWVLDPTLLLSREQYKSLFSYSTERAAIFAYILDEDREKDLIMESLSARLNLPVNKIMPKPINKNNLRNISQCIYPSVEKWLEGVSSSEYVITDSFHGCVFAIIFNKPFYVIANIRRGLSRLTSLLDRLNLQDRLITHPEDINESFMPINWDDINQKIASLRIDSFSFISSSLVR